MAPSYPVYDPYYYDPYYYPWYPFGGPVVFGFGFGGGHSGGGGHLGRGASLKIAANSGNVLLCLTRNHLHLGLKNTNRSDKKPPYIALSCSATVLLSVSAIAQENAIATPGDFARPPQPGEPLWQAGVDSGFVAGGAAKFDGARLTDSDAFNCKLQAGAASS